MDKKFENTPPEIIRNIFKHSDITPSLLHSFEKHMSKETRSQLKTCTQLINDNNFSELKKLKLYNYKGCTHSDLLLAAKKGYEEIVNYINKEYPDAVITKKDIKAAIKSGDTISVKILLKNKLWKYNNDLEYGTLFGYTDKIPILKLIFEAKPINMPLKLSNIVATNMSSRYITFDKKYIVNLIKAGGLNINVDGVYDDDSITFNNGLTLKYINPLTNYNWP